MQISISIKLRSTIKQCSGQLTKTELNYLQHVFNNVLDDCADCLDELIGLITDSELQMKDDERIRRIDGLYTQMQNNQVFVQSFSHLASVLSMQRKNESFDILIEKELNGIK